MIARTAVPLRSPDAENDRCRAYAATRPTSTDLLQAAEVYWALGWTVLPIVGKRPAIRWRHWQATGPDRNLIATQFARPNVTGLAILTGRYPDQPGPFLAVRDFDCEDAYYDWTRRFPNIARTVPTVQTARGYHVYFWSPVEMNRRFPDGELKASRRGYVLAPPSWHPAGLAYSWLTPFPLIRETLPILHPTKVGLISITQIPLISAGVSHKQYSSSAPSALTTDSLMLGGGVSLDPGAFGAGVWDAIEVTLPTGPGQRNARVFDFARSLKAMPHLAEADANDLLPIARAWWQRALPVIQTRSWDVTWQDFRTAWRNVAYPPGSGGPAISLMRDAAAAPEHLEAATYPDKAVKRLVAVCRALDVASRRAGGENGGAFYLSCRTAADVCGFGTYRTAARWLARLVDRQWLTRVVPGERRADGGKAAYYRVATNPATPQDKPFHHLPEV